MASWGKDCLSGKTSPLGLGASERIHVQVSEAKDLGAKAERVPVKAR